MTKTLLKPVDGKIQVLLKKIPSLNEFYSSKHWTIRKKYKDKIALEVLSQLSQYEPVTYPKIQVELRCNVRLDLDNSIMAVKLSLDAFKHWGGVKDDSPKYVTKISMLVDKELEYGTCQIFFSPML